MISMYDVSVPVFSERLRALALVLTKAEANAAERKIDPQVFLTARLAPDMLTLTKQVQIATDHAKGAPSRLAGREVPRYEDNEASFAELQARIAKTRDYLATFTPAEIDGSEERTVTLKVGGKDCRDQGPEISARCRHAELLFPHHHGLRHPAPQRRAAGQGQLPRQGISSRLYRTANSRARRGKSAGRTPRSLRSALHMACSRASAAR